MRKWIAITACVACLLCCVNSMQGSLMGDSHAITGWKGHAYYIDTLNLGLAAWVEYAVFAPSKFKLSYSGRDPNVDSMYVYAYQIFNNDPDHPNQNVSQRAYVNRFSVGMEGNEKAGNRFSIHESGDIISNTGSLSSTSVKWSFYSPNITYGNVSDILYFASPYSPETDTCTLQGNGATLTLNLPSPSNIVAPAPEPVSAFWLVLATMTCRRVRGRRTPPKEGQLTIARRHGTG